jgi:hypothetical protein
MKRGMNDSGGEEVHKSDSKLVRLGYTVNTRTISTTFLFVVYHIAYLLLSSTKMVVVEAEASEFSKTNEKIHTHTSPQQWH